MKEQTKEAKELVLGVDDAGRGPVIGPMVLAGCLMDRETEAELKKEGAKDSKLLTPKQRENLAEIIKKKTFDFHFHIISPVEIDTGMGTGLNLNQVEALAAAAIINKLTQKLSEEEKKKLVIILDCPSINKQGWLNQLVPYLNEKGFHIKCEHKADRDYPVVSAASIIAKTTRDAEIEKLKKELGVDFGSGYPSDPFTKQFLEKNVLNFKKERIFRESWATWQEARNKALGLREKASKQTKLLE